MRRTEIRRTAKRSRPRDTGPSVEVVAMVWQRDGGTCAVCGNLCSGQRGWDWSVQHRLRRGSGGTSRDWINLPANLLLLHGSGTTQCHGRVEKEPAWAERNGYRVVDGRELPSAVPVLHVGLGRSVLLADDGTWEAA